MATTDKSQDHEPDKDVSVHSTMPLNKPLKISLSKYPELSHIISEEDPENLYYDQREIGHGSFGAVYYARYCQTEEIVAIKKMQFTGIQATEGIIHVWTKEVKFLSQLKHENTTGFKGCYLKGSTCWVVMEYCLGSASDVVKVHKSALHECEISEICKGALLGLQYLHSKDRIHRDVKAGNILLTDNGIVKLADFGSASEHSPANTFIGTPFWMAPEVILAMDEGVYNSKVDIWSIGITCIEMAEKKPPLFHMNEMAALYHIALKDAPTLKEPNQWSETFRDFVKGCLVKEPEKRFTTEEALEHTFISALQDPGVVYKLITRTKEAVRHVDRQNFKRLQKMLVVKDEAESDTTSVDIESEPPSDIPDPMGEEVLCSSPAISSPSSSLIHNEDAISTDSSTKVGMGSLLGGVCERISKEDRLASSTEVEEHVESPTNYRKTSDNKGPIVRSEYTGEVVSRSSNNSLLRSGNIASATASVTPKSPFCGGFGLEDNTSELGEGFRVGVMKGVEVNIPPILSTEEMAKRVDGHSDGFSTLRPHSLVSKEAHEHQLQSNLKEQMQGYKRIRAQHKGQLEQLVLKHRNERSNLFKVQEKELDQVQQTYKKDIDKLRQSHKTDLEKRLKQEMSDDRKFQRGLRDRQDQDMKQFLSQQKANYRATKVIYKKEIDGDVTLTSSQRKKLYEERKSELQTKQKGNEEEHLQVLRTKREHDMVDFRQKMLHERQVVEKQLLQEELNLMQLHKERVQDMRRRHLLLTIELQYEQLTSLREMRTDHLNRQHSLEWDNQITYSKKAERELGKKHDLELKQHPKSLRSKQQQIKTNFNDTVKIQQKQYKSLQKHLTATLPKEKHTEVLKPLKEEQMRKMHLHAMQYERTINEVLQQQKVMLGEAWLVEQEVLQKRLQQEQDLLQQFQEKQEAKLLDHHDRKRKLLDEKVETNQRELDRQIFEESTKLQNLRLERQQQLQQKHLKELKDFAVKYSSDHLSNTF